MLFLTFSFYISYEPELFPGLIYRMVKPRIVLLIFVSGKVVLTGKFYDHFLTFIKLSTLLFLLNGFVHHYKAILAIIEYLFEK